MPEIAFYRKYRPSNFANLVGQNHVRTTLLSALKNDRLVHAYLFSGPRGTGKTSTARLLAKAINCVNRKKDGEPCEECEFCLAIKEGRLIDLIEIDAASNRGIDEIRDLREKIKFAPTRGKAKIYIIDEVHMLTKEAFNALLKTLEEPPSHTYFVLATTEPHKVLPTIISRCQQFDFKRISEKEIIERLKFIAGQEKIKVEEEALELIVQNVQGSLRDAVGLLEQMIEGNKLTYQHLKETLGIIGHQAIKRLHQNLQEQKVKEALQEINELHREGYDLSQFTREMLDFLRRQMIEAASRESPLVKRILELIEIFQKAQDDLKTTIIPQLPLEVAIIKACRLSPLVSPKQSLGEKIKTAFHREKEEGEKESLVAVPQEKRPAGILSLENIKKNFPRILEHIKIPSVKRSFMTGTISKVEGQEIVINFKTRFHLEKVEGLRNKDEVEKAFTEVFGKPVKITCELTKVDFEPVVAEEVFEPKPEEEKPNPNLTKKALEIFGGDLME